jgi:uroporphyrinogen-III synthase
MPTQDASATVSRSAADCQQSVLALPGTVTRIEDDMKRVCSFESRRSEEMWSLIERYGGEATIAPSMKEVALPDSSPVFDFVRRVLDGKVDLVIFLTGVGTRGLLEAAATKFELPTFIDALNRLQVIVRGPKPMPVLRDAGIHVDIRAPEPNTWREILIALDAAEMDVRGKRITIHEYGAPNPELESALRERGAEVETVSVYRWSLPDDVAPLEAAIRKTIEGGFDGLMFTSAQQAIHVLKVAERMGVKEEWLAAANRCTIASIGPTATETLVGVGLPPTVEAEHGKMGHLVKAYFEHRR